MKIFIETIPHTEQRYDTAGDWWEDHDGTVQIRSSQTGNADYDFLVAFHELAEWYLCKRHGIPQKAVDDWDEECIAERPNVEPGGQSDAPYHREHMQADIVERVLAQALGVDWNAYEKVLDGLE